LEQAAANYYDHLSAEVSATSQLLNYLKEGKDDHVKLKASYKKFADSHNFMPTIKDAFSSEKTNLTAAQLAFMVENLENAVNNPDSIESAIQEHSTKLNQLKNQLVFEQGRMPLIINSAKQALETVKYSANHETHLFGLQTI